MAALAFATACLCFASVSSSQNIQASLFRESQDNNSVNFTGKWALHRIEGDVDQFFKDQNWSWAFRKVACAIIKSGYDMQQTITHSGHQYKSEDEGVPRNKNFRQTYELEIGGKSIPWITPTEEPAQLRAEWNNDKTMMITKSREKVPKITYRYLDGEHLVEIAKCLNREGKPMDGSIKHVYRRVN
eukprot:CAMPEP_0167755732 /NCGR_PEP_ID=MMETSP0110_2-20121227/8990_1 /TAXON_ID=629695 /ORGANISM="Gymnochlora sp., Strain CCMP2014" /LENGTH=185 /DNA_ID=CAMNT_0007641757 /DNA_START=16 /DNA_END=573 /DNA_ORIENTATION=+